MTPHALGRTTGRSRFAARLLAAAAGIVLLPGFALAGEQSASPWSAPLSFETTAARPEPVGEATSPAPAASTPYYFDTAPADEKPNIHGFFSSPFKTSYVTPRGLVVENSGVVWQPVVGLIFPIGKVGPFDNFALIGGIWNSVNSAQGDPQVGPWNEMDVFFSMAGDLDKFTLTLTYGAWNFPQSTPNKPDTEHNIDLKVAYNDSGWWGGDFALKPYVELFYEVGGSSTVVLGRGGSTGYLEIGISPTFTYKGITNYPVTLTFPVYTSVGPAEYWDATKSSGNWGLVSAGINASVPLNFIPARYGNWHLDAGVTYYYLINDALLQAGTILSGNDNRNVVQGSLGVGVNF